MCGLLRLARRGRTALDLANSGGDFLDHPDRGDLLLHRLAEDGPGHDGFAVDLSGSEDGQHLGSEVLDFCGAARLKVKSRKIEGDECYVVPDFGRDEPFPDLEKSLLSKLDPAEAPAEDTFDPEQAKTV